MRGDEVRVGQQPIKRDALGAQFALGLTDRDRRPWLKRLHTVLAAGAAAKRPVVLACSALTERYRTILIGDLLEVRVVYLRITPELARQRVGERTHFFHPGLLTNQS